MDEYTTISQHWRKRKRERERTREMTMVRERRHQQHLRLRIPPPSSPPLPQPHFLHTADTPSNLEKLCVIGHSTTATVYMVRDRHSLSLYALKVLSLDLDNAIANARQRALREADIHRRLDSEYVVRCYGVVPDGGHDKLAILMDYMDGGTLEDVLRTHQRPLTEDLIANVARRVLMGLLYLHENGVVHRDIKPSNLLIDKHGDVKIADLGASRVVVSGEVWDPCAGTCAYMSPERMDGEGFGGGEDGGGFAGDVWALGVVVMECKVGRFPLVEAGERPDWATLMAVTCFGEPALELPESASMELQSFVERCLEKDWRKRGTLSELLVHPFVARQRHLDENEQAVKLIALT